MLIISTVPQAIGLMIAGVFLLGTWPAVWNLIEQRGKIPSHIFLDYALTYLVFASVVALTLGQLGPLNPTAAAAAAAGGSSSSSPSLNFLDQIYQLNAKLVAFAVGGGFCLALGDLGMQYATAMLGLSIGPPLLNALTVIIGVILSYFLDEGINKPQLVFPGMACAALAIALGAAGHLSNQQTKRAAARQQQQQQQEPGSSSSGQIKQQKPSAASPSLLQDDSAKEAGKAVDCVVELPDPNPSNSQHQPQQQQQQQQPLQQQQQGCTVILTSADKVQQQRSIQVADKHRFLGLAIAVVGGVIYGLFLPAFQIAATDPFQLQPAGVPPLSVYSTYFFFSCGFTGSSVVINVLFLYKPPLGTASSSIAQYLKDNDGRGLAILSGVLAAAGDLTQFIGGQTAGYAACMLVMAYPVVGVVWGLVRFAECRQGSGFSKLMIAGQVLCYATAVGLLAGSAELRHHHR